jgi:PGF-CTERM protein
MKKISLRVLVILVAVTMVLSISATASEADVTVTSVTASPESVEVGENVTITATVENTGNTTETVPIVFKINGEEVKSVNVTVEANATEAVECVVAEEEVGTYNVTVDGASASFTVTAPPSPTPSPTPSPIPSATPTPEVTPTPTPVPPTPTPSGNSEEKFRVGPKVRLRPRNDVIAPNADGLIELYMSNPALNDVTLTVQVWVDIPTGIDVTGEGFAMDVAAGTANALFEVTPGTSKAIYVNIRPVESYEERTVFIHASGYYWPGQNKDDSYPISLTHPLKIQPKPVATPTPAPGETPKPPGFEAILAIAALLAVAYLVGRKK